MSLCKLITLVQNPWLDANIRLGPLGSLYPQVVFGMEGDTPSFLLLIQNGLGYRDRIYWGSWGGRYSRSLALVDWAGGIDTNHFVDSVEIRLALTDKSIQRHKHLSGAGERLTKMILRLECNGLSLRTSQKLGIRPS